MADDIKKSDKYSIVFLIGCLVGGILSVGTERKCNPLNEFKKEYSPINVKIRYINNDSMKDLAMRTNKGYVLFYGVKDGEIPHEVLDSLVGKRSIILQKQQQLKQERDERIKRINEDYEKSLEKLIN